MSDADLPVQALAIIEVVAGAIRDELGEEVDAYPGRLEPEGADPLNRAFRAVVRAILGPNTSGIEGTYSLVSRALHCVAGRRLTAEGLLDEPAGLAALPAGEAPGLDLGLTCRRDGDLDDLQDAPPTVIDSLMEPSASGCSTTEWPRRRASILALSTA